MLLFHRRCGDRVSLVNGQCTAVRDVTEFNFGLVFSAEPLRNDEVFQVRIDKKIMIWSGSIEIGVTTCDPDNTNLPASATSLRHGSWIMTGSSIVYDGEPISEVYGADLSTLDEGNTLGVCRTSKGELVFYVNGSPQGIAATNIPSRVYAVINMYGNCVQVTTVQPPSGSASNCSNGEATSHQIEINNDYTMDEASSSLITNLVANLNVNLNVLPKNPSLAAIREDRLRFHERVGSLVKLSNNARTAERRRPLDEFNNGVVMTHRSLRDNELFEIRIDRLVDKWSGSIEVGVTTHSPTALEFPATMTNMRSGTTMMSGCGILTNGKGTQREYGEFNLDELREGDRVGMMRKSNGNLHYFINGLDQGVASKVPNTIWGVIDLYGMTVKVTIVDRDEREEQNLITRRNTLQLQGINEGGETEEPLDRLMFHPCCGTRADVINNGRTAHRPNAIDDFNNGVVLTSRPLRPNELFEVRLDKIVTKWAGSIEIGVTTHSPTELEFPFTMTNVRSGTWMMTGNGVMHNGTTMIDQYGQNLDRLQVGDRVGVMRKDNSTLHFYVNGSDQGAAASGVPERVYGVIDLYGQAAQATIVDNSDFCSPTTINSSLSNTTLYWYENENDLRFHHVHGKNARITNNGLTASRPRALGEFNDAIVVANRALRDGEMFEVSIDKMVDRWSGAIEAGVTAIRPDELEFPSTMTDIDHDTWMLSGSTVMRDGVALRHNYSCDLDKLAEGNRIGMMRCADASLHYYLDGVDQGTACTGLPAHVYPVIDLYGQCAQVTIVIPERRDMTLQQYLPSENSTTSQQPTSVVQALAQTEITHKFHESVGLNIQLDTGRTVATRCREYSNAVLLSETALENNEIFEISIQEVAREWSGSLRIGLISNESGSWLSSMNLVQGMTSIPADAWYLTGNQVRHKGQCLCWNYCPSLDWLRVGDKIGLKRTNEGNLKFYVNREDMGVAASNVPEMCYAVVELFGSTVAVCITSTKQQNTAISPNASLRLQDSLELLLDPMPPGIRNEAGMDTSVDTCGEGKQINEIVTTPTQLTVASIGETDWSYEFHENHGRNVQLEKKTVARRVASYNQGVVMSNKPLIKNKLFQVKIDKINERWVSGMLCGVSCVSPEKVTFPVTALGLKKHSWIICGDWISHNGTKVRSSYGANLESLRVGSTVGLLLDEDSRLHLYIDGSDQGIAASDLPSYVYAVIDLYGQCEQVSIIGPSAEAMILPLLNENEMLNNDTNNATVSAMERLALETDDVENSREKADLECHEKESGAAMLVDEMKDGSAEMSVQDEGGCSRTDDQVDEMESLTNVTAKDNDLASRNSQSSNKELKQVPASSTMSSSLQSDTNCSEHCSDAVSTSETTSNIPDNNTYADKDVIPPPLHNNNVTAVVPTGSIEDNCEGNSSDIEPTADNNDSCTNVELNNATNINIKNGSVINSTNMTNLNTAISGSNANNAINESIASNSSQNNNNATTTPSLNIRTWHSNHCAPSAPQELVLNLHRHSLSFFNQQGFQISNNCFSNNILTTAAQQTISTHASMPSTPLATSNHITPPPSKKCEYLKACVRLKKSLVLPDEFFSLDEILCYCSSCFKIDGDSVICKKGEPLAEFAIPVGWVRFPLKHNINANQIPQSTTDKWHVAFYGTRIDTVRWILDRGELLTKEQLDTDSLTTGTSTEDQNPQVVFSPNIKCASSEEFTKQYSYIDTQLNKKVNASTAFQLLVRPGSYTTSSKKDGLDSQLECIEWATKETGATVIIALLIHLDGF
ncbi:hypothetical protein TSAR_003159 [Trichomalopsis sarcophagae]|uniref:NHR domain-containing protein n=1 Tax=Trichomalopsis sarcophagae TaxID=543379 RepID=A0A232FB74_9HYME|nr:hypothetical protein TSAR_003159 [Trichomalopsis sarcophagae]